MNDKEMFAVAHAERGVQQNELEIIWALDEIRRYFEPHQPKVVVEIGCARGGALCMWSQLLDHDGLLVGISPGPAVWKSADAVAAITGKPLEWINGRSENSDTMDRLLEVLNGRKIDVCILDTVHTYKQSEIEFPLYHPLVDTPGIFAFHDIVQGGLVSLYDEPCTGDYWHEIKYKYDYIEKHNWRSGNNFGIGMLLL